MQRRLVRGRSGVTGIAWEPACCSGCGTRLRRSGRCDTGSVLAGIDRRRAVLRFVELESLRRQLGEAPGEIAAESNLQLLATIFGELAGGRLPDQEGRARIGALALGADTVPEPVRRAVIEQRLPSHEWPSTRLLITAVDAVTGELAVFDAASGASLVDAVAASCAVPGVVPAGTIGGRRYVEAGALDANADLRRARCRRRRGAVTGPAAGTLDPEWLPPRRRTTVVVLALRRRGRRRHGPEPPRSRLRRAAAEHGRRQDLAASSHPQAELGSMSSQRLP